MSPYGVAAGDCIGHPPTHIVERWQLAVTSRAAAAAEAGAAAPMNSNNKDASDGCGDGALPLGGRVYRLTKLVEKPTVEFARENLLTPGLGPGPDGEGSHLVVFGQYILPARRTFDILAENIRADRRERCAARPESAEAPNRSRLHVTTSFARVCLPVCVSVCCLCISVFDCVLFVRV